MTVFLIGVQYSKTCFLITYVVLITFQARINRQRYMLVQMSAYIRVFFEDERNDLHWEHSKLLIPHRRNSHRRFISRISGTVPVQLGILSLTCYVGYTMREIYYDKYAPIMSFYIIICIIQSITYVEWFFIILSIVCTVLLGYLVKKYRIDYYPEMDKSFKEYKEILKLNGGYIKHKNLV